MRMPTFLIIGTMKGGTTTLYQLLNQHPQVYMSPVKEPNFFAYQGGRPKRAYPPGLPYPVWIVDSPDVARRAMELKVDAATFTTLSAYGALWEDESAPQRGEASVLYLYLHHVAESIARMNSDMKIIVILRNPVDRGYSHFLMARRMGREPIESFAEALAAEKARLAENYDPFWHYLSLGFYYEQLERYFKVFDSSQILVLLNEDLKEQFSTTYVRMLNFLGVDPSFEPGPEKEYGVGGEARNRWLYHWATRPSLTKALIKGFIPKSYHATLMKKLALRKQGIDPQLRMQLSAIYHDDIMHLEELTGRDLTNWKCYG